jgi:hypothetical protein
MTKQRDFKALVRERMAKTGERYTAARAHLLAKPDRTSGAAEPPPGVLDGYDRFGGIQSGTAAVHNVYAGFLEEAAAACGRPLLQSAATTYREAGALWGQIAGLIANCQDAAVRQACEISDRRLELGDASRDDVSKESAELWRRRHTIAGECRLTKATALGLYADMATLVGRIADAERAAVDQLHAALRAL